MKYLISLFIVFSLILVTFNLSPIAETTKPIFGIDVSRWQGEIDWIEVKNDGVDFAILRAYSYGEDIYFQKNYTEAIAAGLNVGAYSYTYAETIDEAIAEANNIVSVLGKRKFHYPIFIDIEDPSYYSIDKNLTTQIVLTELEILKKAGYYAAVYSGKYFAEDYLNLSALSNYDMWIAQYNSSCTYNKNYTMWQYSDSGSIKGISGAVDTNYCYVDYPKIISNSGLNYLNENSIFPCNGLVTADILNVRSGPSTANNVIAKIPKDFVVTINGIENISGWYYISFTDENGKYFAGYCSGDYIKLQTKREFLGDVDLSGVVDVADALTILQHSVGKIILSQDTLNCADVNFDGIIDANDALCVLQYSVGKITSFN